MKSHAKSRGSKRKGPPRTDAPKAWLIVREGAFRYLKSRDSCDAYSTKQADAYRFKTKLAAQRAMLWSVCLHSSWPVRIVPLYARRSTFPEAYARHCIAIGRELSAHTRHLSALTDTLHSVVVFLTQFLQRQQGSPK